MTKANPPLFPLHGWLGAWAVLLAWFPAALLGVYLKQTFMSKHYLVISRFLGLKGEALPFLDRLSFFRADLLLLFVIMPLIFVWVLRRMPLLYARWLVWVALGFTFFCYVNLLALGNVGQFISWGMFQDAIAWGIKDPQIIAQYVEPDGLVKLGVIASLILLPFQIARSARLVRLARLQAYGAMGGVGGAVVLVGLSFFQTVPAMPHHQASTLRALATLVGWGEEGDDRFKGFSQEEMVAFYQTFAQAPEYHRKARYWGKEAESDLVMFVFETGPARSLDIDGSLEGFPTLRRLRQQAFTAPQHYATYPYTSFALYSLLSSHYPSTGSHLRNLIRDHGQKLDLGMMHELKERGYLTKLYTTGYSQFENDKQMFSGLGLSETFSFSSKDSKPPSDFFIQKRDALLASLPPAARKIEGALLDDVTIFYQMVEDIRHYKKEGRRFATLITPKVGHGPWADIQGFKEDYPARGRALMRLHDRMLADLVAMLAQSGGLDNTVIVVVSDHGVRTKSEDPDFVPGKLSDYSFHVPLLIFAPNTLQANHSIPWLTSHIDLSPTILDLMGIASGRESEQGSPLWDERLQQRITFFLAANYLGAEGFYQRGEFTMRQVISGSQYQNRGEMVFPSSSMMLPEQAAEIEQVRKRLETRTMLQKRWVSFGLE
ncbi:MAG: sulfatase-like hydrolase/transferase [Magnetococcales bacterium]|nr:sulfatase-like hydrolase/transferase [Magnetococcales bacterium]